MFFPLITRFSYLDSPSSTGLLIPIIVSDFVIVMLPSLYMPGITRMVSPFLESSRAFFMEVTAWSLPTTMVREKEDSVKLNNMVIMSNLILLFDKFHPSLPVHPFCLLKYFQRLLYFQTPKYYCSSGSWSLYWLQTRPCLH